MPKNYQLSLIPKGDDDGHFRCVITYNGLLGYARVIGTGVSMDEARLNAEDMLTQKLEGRAQRRNTLLERQRRTTASSIKGKLERRGGMPENLDV